MLPAARKIVSHSFCVPCKGLAGKRDGAHMPSPAPQTRSPMAVRVSDHGQPSILWKRPQRTLTDSRAWAQTPSQII